MSLLNNFLTGGHHFPEADNLKKFRFSLLNSLMLIAAIFTSINYLASLFGFVKFSSAYEFALTGFATGCLLSLFALRKNKIYYSFVVAFAISSGLSLFYFALILGVGKDEFRLIWFFLVLFAAFILIGRRYGFLLMLFILGSIFMIDRFFEIGYSKLSLFTFFNSFLIFTGFVYFFLAKIENDAKEFKQLNNKLKKQALYEKQQREAQEQMLLRQCQMANMGEMLDSIAHQWRQPLMHINSILLNMDVALGSNKSPEYLANKIEDISSLTAHMSQTIEDFRGLFKAENEQENFKLAGAINDVIFLLKNNLTDIEIDFNTHDETTVFSYKNELIQVIIILLSNAVEVLHLRQIKNKKIIIQIILHQQRVLLSIEDNAGGIIADNLTTIFDPYFTTKKQSGGTGLGLYIAKIIVEQRMGGKIMAANSPIGAKFIVVLANASAAKA